MENNLKLWEAVEKTDAKYTKEVSLGGRKYTSVDAYYRIKQATKSFGNFGQGWWVQAEEFDYNSVPGLCIYTATLCYDADQKQGNIPIRAAIATHMQKSVWKDRKDTGVKESIPDEDFIKKVTTDALTKGLSFLGFSADVYLGKFEDAGYKEQTAKELAELTKDTRQELEFNLGLCVSEMDVMAIWSQTPSELKQNKEYLQMMTDKRNELKAIAAQELFALSEEEAILNNNKS